MKKVKYNRILYLFVSFILLLMMLYGSGCSTSRETTTTATQEGQTVTVESPKVVITGSSSESKGISSETSPRVSPSVTQEPVKPKPLAEESIGFSVGGAKDIGNFRENIRNDYLPLPTDITYEGLFYDYYFDTGEDEECQKLFCPSYSFAVTDDPFSGETEYYLSVGLNSGLQESDFQRKKLNLVVVLDMSGSMKSPFDSFYYDGYGNRKEIPGIDPRKEKIEIATESIATLLDHLNREDLFGMVLFNNNAKLLMPLSPFDTADKNDMKEDILDITAFGSTHLSAGLNMATGLFDEMTGVNPDEYENRIIFLTDAMPNTGDISTSGLFDMVKENADNQIYTTFIGIGVDFNTELVESITKIRGANYYSVHSAEQFRERMDDEFEFMVTPLVFDLQLKLRAEGWRIEKVYGSPQADEATGRLMEVKTLFPSKKSDGETKGGLILLKLRQKGEGGDIHLTTSYEDRNGRFDSSEKVFRINGEGPEYFDNTGIRKGVLLSRYANLLKDWLIDEYDHSNSGYQWKPSIDENTGISIPEHLGQWERQSLPLVIARPYRKLFGMFYTYFEEEINFVHDESLEQELDILNILIDN